MKDKIYFYLPGECPSCGEYKFDRDEGYCSGCGYNEYSTEGGFGG